MNTETLVAIGSIVLANIGTSIFLFTWATNHAANDNKFAREEFREAHNDTRSLLKAIHDETRDFHTRLCLIEANRKE